MVCPVPALEKTLRRHRTLGAVGVLSIYESSSIEFSLVAAHRKDANNLMRIQSIVAIPTGTTKFTCGGRAGQTAFPYCKEKEIGVNAENVFKYLKGYYK